ncbi:hypothetical protein IL306_000119 [Fusarium sp. DS 682]|nr:hypothetical protein IL306_000119 [Fusarium sp. DS 682]
MSLSKPERVQDLVIQNPRVRVWAQPLEWTEAHLVLIKAFFNEVPADKIVDDGDDDVFNPPEGQDPLATGERTARRLALSPMKNDAMKRLIAADNGPFVLQRLHGFFCFGKKHELRLHGMVYARRTTDSYAGVFAFMQKGMIRLLREGIFTLPRALQGNAPAEWVRDIRINQLEPADQWHEPYILGVLVGLAQSQAEEKSSPKYPFAEDHLFKTCAAFTDDNHDFLYFYSAEISVAFLSKFEYPADLMKPKDAMSSELSIKMKKVFYRPYHTFKTRILTEIISAMGEKMEVVVGQGRPKE